MVAVSRGFATQRLTTQWSLHIYMKLLLPPLAIAAMISLFSCKKGNSDFTFNPTGDPCDQVNEVLLYNLYAEPVLQHEADVTYDKQGRVKSIIGHGKNRSDYTYYNDRIELKATDIFGNDISVTYFLDSKRRITRTSYFDFQYTYNEEGYLTSLFQPYGTGGVINGSTLNLLSYANGDLVRITNETDNSELSDIKFTYYEEPNQDMMGYNNPLYISGLIGDRPSFFLMKAGYYGRLSTHLMQSVKFNNNYSPWPINYTKDGKGRVVSMVGKWTFNYACP